MCSASNISLLFFCRGADEIIVHVNVCVGLFSRCLAGSDFVEGVSCSVHLVSAFLIVSPIYLSLQEHVPS